MSKTCPGKSHRESHISLLNVSSRLEALSLTTSCCPFHTRTRLGRSREFVECYFSFPICCVCVLYVLYKPFIDHGCLFILLSCQTSYLKDFLITKYGKEISFRGHRRDLWFILCLNEPTMYSTWFCVVGFTSCILDRGFSRG